MTLLDIIAADLDAVFFNTNDYAVTATHVPTGAPLRIIFDEQYQGIGADGMEIASSAPQARAMSADVVGFNTGDLITLGARVFVLAGPPESIGAGVSILKLSEKTEEYPP